MPTRVQVAAVCLVLFVFFVLRSYLARNAGFLDHPVKDVIVLVAHSIKEIFEKLSQVPNVWLLLEFQTATISQVKTNFFRKVFAQRLNLGRQLLISDLLVLLLFGSRWDSLPWELTLDEVKQYIAQ